MKDHLERVPARRTFPWVILAACGWLGGIWVSVHFFMLWLEFSLTLADATPQVERAALISWRHSSYGALLLGLLVSALASWILTVALRLIAPAIANRKRTYAGILCTAIVVLLAFVVAGASGGLLVDSSLESFLRVVVRRFATMLGSPS